jgi:hypothetical protein
MSDDWAVGDYGSIFLFLLSVLVCRLRARFPKVAGL